MPEGLLNRIGGGKSIGGIQNVKKEGNMKRTCVIACVMLAATLVFGSMASASHWSWWYGFHGTYEMVASGICNHSTLGWDETPGGFIPKAGSKIWAANATIRGTIHFNRDGTGSLSGTNYIS